MSGPWTQVRGNTTLESIFISGAKMHFVSLTYLRPYLLKGGIMLTIPLKGTPKTHVSIRYARLCVVLV